MKNENTDNENIVNVDDVENTSNSENSENLENTTNTENSDNTENSTNIDNSVSSENTSSNTIQNVDLQIIHEDLGIIISFIALFSIVLLVHYAYKFFKMFF